MADKRKGAQWAPVEMSELGYHEEKSYERHVYDVNDETEQLNK